MLKKMVAQLLAVVMLVTLFPFEAMGGMTVSAQNTTTLTVSDVTGTLGDIVEVTVAISADSYFVNGDFGISYDVDCLRYVEDSCVASDKLRSDFYLGSNESIPGEVQIALASGENVGVTESGILLSLQFEIVDSNVGETTIFLTANSLRGCNGGDDFDVRHTVENGTVYITGGVPNKSNGINFLTDAFDVCANSETASFNYADGKLEFTATEAGQELALVLAEAANVNEFPYVDLAIESDMAFNFCFNDANNGKWIYAAAEFNTAFGTSSYAEIPAGSYTDCEMNLAGFYTWNFGYLPKNAAIKQIIFIAKEAGTMTVSKCEMVTAPATTAPEETTTTVDETKPTKPPVLGTETKIDFFAYGDVFGDESVYTLEDGVFTFNATAAEQEVAFVLNGEANLNVVPFLKLAIESEIPFDICFNDQNNNKWMFAVGDFCYNFENNQGPSNPLPAGTHSAKFSLTGAYTWTGAPLPANAAVKQIIFIAKAPGKMTVNTCQMYDGVDDVVLFPENTANPDWTVESLIADNAAAWIPTDPAKSGDSEIVVTYDAENGFMNFGNTNGNWPSASIEVNKSVEYATSGLYVDLSVLKGAATTLYVFFGEATPDEFEGADKAYGTVLADVSAGNYYGYVKLTDILPEDSDVIDEYGNVNVSFVKVYGTSIGDVMDPAVVVKALDLGYTVSTTKATTTTTTTRTTTTTTRTTTTTTRTTTTTTRTTTTTTRTTTTTTRTTTTTTRTTTTTTRTTTTTTRTTTTTTRTTTTTTRTTTTTVPHTYKTIVNKATLTKSGSIVKKCTICGKVASTTTIRYAKTFKLSATSYTYDGKVKSPTVTVKDAAGKTLKKGTDYTVTYASGRKNVGTYKVTVKMIGNYSGAKTLSFKIVPVKVDKLKLKLSATSYTYDGKVKSPSVSVKTSSGKTLKKGTDYTVTYASGRKNVGTYKVTVKMKGNYSGTKTLSFKITPIKIDKLKVKLSATSYTYDGKVKLPSVSVKTSSGKTLKKGTDYSVTHASGRKNVGTYKVTVKMKGNYSGTKTLSFKIVPVKVDKLKLKLSATSYTYDGKAKTPSVTVKNATGKTLKKGTDYTVSYAGNRKSVGEYKMTVKMKGNYSGTKTLTYTVLPSANKTISMFVGDTASIGAKSDKAITYASSNAGVVKVNTKGVVTALKAGTVTITVKSGGVSQKVTVKVTSPTVKIKSPKSSMYIGDAIQLTATTTPSGVRVAWSVNNTGIATISSSGVLKALDEGTVAVTAKITYAGKTYTDTYNISISVEYPDISIYMTGKTAVSNYCDFDITNNSDAPLKVLSNGWVYCNGKKENIVSLAVQSYVIGSGYPLIYHDQITVGAHEMELMKAVVANDIPFKRSSWLYMNVYLEYKGEIFIAKCTAEKTGINKCFGIDWVKR